MQRNASLELFRIVMMLGICWLHCSQQGGLFQETRWIYRDMRPCVVGFVFLTGYFGMSFKLSKAFKLTGVCLWCALISVLLRNIAVGSALGMSVVWDVGSSFVKGYWFFWASREGLAGCARVQVKVADVPGLRLFDRCKGEHLLSFEVSGGSLGRVNLHDRTGKHVLIHKDEVGIFTCGYASPLIIYEQLLCHIDGQSGKCLLTAQELFGPPVVFLGVVQHTCDSDFHNAEGIFRTA